MVVGGQDTRSSSPSQVLGMYRSYSGGAGARPLDDSHLRMSVGSFGGHSVLGYNRSYGDPLPPPSNYYPGPVRSHEGSDRMPHFYVLLRKFNESFKDCTFLLPGVKLSLMDSKDSDRKGESELAAHGDEPSVSGVALFI